MTKCILPWIHLEATATGLAKPCCLYKEKIYINNQQADLSKFSIQEVWNSDHMNNLRKEFLDNKNPSGCRACWEMESAGKRSKRQISNEWFSHHLERFNENLQDPVYLDLKLGTVCNLKCRSCSSFSSSKWAEDEIKLYKSPLNSNIHSYWINEDSPVWSEIELLLSSIEYFDFTGGEPFLVKRHFKLLEKCVELDYAKNITIHYNTNGTVEPTDKMFEIWSHFKSVDVMFSIDGVDKKFEYLRHPGKWKQIELVLNKFRNKPKFYTSICCSISVFNVLYMNEFINWFIKLGLEDHQLYFNLIWNPDYLNIQSLSKNHKEQIKDLLIKTKTQSDFLNQRVQEVINFMFDKELILADSKKFIKITQKIDNIREESFSNTFSELDKILKL